MPYEQKTTNETPSTTISPFINPQTNLHTIEVAGFAERIVVKRRLNYFEQNQIISASRVKISEDETIVDAGSMVFMRTKLAIHNWFGGAFDGMPLDVENLNPEHPVVAAALKWINENVAFGSATQNEKKA
ncbi:hypothetical protein HC928_08000 [bacterium]|nr:hypothetical protein [bacterium]